MVKYTRCHFSTVIIARVIARWLFPTPDGPRKTTLCPSERKRPVCNRRTSMTHTRRRPRFTQTAVAYALGKRDDQYGENVPSKRLPMRSRFTLLCALPLAGSVYAFWTIVLTHLSSPGYSTGWWGVPRGSTAPQHFGPYWLGLWLLGVIFAMIASKCIEPLSKVARITVILHAFPIGYEVWALMKGPY